MVEQTKQSQANADAYSDVGEPDNVHGDAWSQEKGWFLLASDAHTDENGVRVWSKEKEAWIKVSREDLQRA